MKRENVKLPSRWWWDEMAAKEAAKVTYNLTGMTCYVMENRNADRKVNQYVLMPEREVIDRSAACYIYAYPNPEGIQPDGSKVKHNQGKGGQA